MSWRKARMRDLQKNAWNWGINNGFVINEGILWKPMNMITSGFRLAGRVFCPKFRGCKTGRVSSTKPNFVDVPRTITGRRQSAPNIQKIKKTSKEGRALVSALTIQNARHL